MKLDEFMTLRGGIMAVVLRSGVSIEDAAPIVMGIWLKMLNETSGDEYELVKKETNIIN